MNAIDEWVADEYEKFSGLVVTTPFNPKFKDIESYIEYRNFFSNHEAAVHLRKKIQYVLDEQIKTTSNAESLKLKEQKIWLNRPFFAIVFLDGDGMGSVLRDLAKKDQYPLMADISKALSTFASTCGEKIEENNGKLFYAGGEDVFFMVHPASLLPLVKMIAEKYQELVAAPFRDQINKIFSEQIKLTISGGAYICHHKHPLKLAIEGAHNMESKAKNQPGKNSLAIQLHKGTGERAEIVFPILKQDGEKSFFIEDFMTLIDQVNSGDVKIPRGFVYKLIEEYPVMQSVIKGKNDLLNYIDFILEKSRDGKKTDTGRLGQLIEHSIQCGSEGIDYKALINRLYFLRFLTGDEA